MLLRDSHIDMSCWGNFEDDYLPKILAADAVKHEIYAEICDEESVKYILKGNCRVLVSGRFRLWMCKFQETK